ncbi:MAG: HesB/IscA family protein [bacterium]
MLTITDSAAGKMKEILSAEGKKEWGIRLYAEEGGGCCSSYGLDLAERASENDDVIEKDGVRVFVEKHMSALVADMTIDFLDDGTRQGFVLTGGSCGTGNDPSCGCGCSSC